NLGHEVLAIFVGRACSERALADPSAPRPARPLQALARFRQLATGTHVVHDGLDQRLVLLDTLARDVADGDAAALLAARDVGAADQLVFAQRRLHAIAERSPIDASMLAAARRFAAELAVVQRDAAAIPAQQVIAGGVADAHLPDVGALGVGVAAQRDQLFALLHALIRDGRAAGAVEGRGDGPRVQALPRRAAAEHVQSQLGMHAAAQLVHPRLGWQAVFPFLAT